MLAIAAMCIATYSRAKTAHIPEASGSGARRGYITQTENRLMLLPEHVIPFLQHDDPIVRHHAKRYFHDSYDFGPLTADHYWAAIDRFGENDDTLDLAAELSHLPQTDQSLHRLVRALSGKSSDDFEFHLQRAAREMELTTLVRNKDELLACPRLLPHVRQHLELRLSLLDETPQSAWDQLMQHGRELGEEYASQFQPSLSDALIEAAARSGAPVGDQAMIALADPSAAEDWREIFAVRVLGHARYEAAVAALVDKFAIDADVLREETNRALSRIGTLEVIQRLADFYPGKPWDVRLYADGPLESIKRPQSVDALLKVLQVELAIEANPDADDEGGDLVEQALLALVQLGSLAGLDESRRLIAQSPHDPEMVDLAECLIATAAMNGVTLDEESTWRRRAKIHQERFAGRRPENDPMLTHMREQWRATGMSFPHSGDAGEENGWAAPPPLENLSDTIAAPVLPIRNTAPKIGRNDPCPCGSGKKYKKCCGM
jgi:hypothetical protein